MASVLKFLCAHRFIPKNNARNPTTRNIGPLVHSPCKNKNPETETVSGFCMDFSNFIPATAGRFATSYPARLRHAGGHLYGEVATAHPL
jgi:hypothetical protein